MMTSIEFAEKLNMVRMANINKVFTYRQITPIIIRTLRLHGKGIFEKLIELKYLESIEENGQKYYSFSNTPLYHLRAEELKPFCSLFDEEKEEVDPIKEAISLLLSTGEYEIRRKVIRIEYEEIKL